MKRLGLTDAATAILGTEEFLPAVGQGAIGIEARAGDARTREMLTAAQVAISIVLLVGASLVLRSLLKLREVDPGFDPSRVVYVESESRKIGELRIPDALLKLMRTSDCVRLEVPLAPP